MDGKPMTDFRDKITQQIRDARISKGMTQEDVAEASGLSRSTITKIETGQWSFGVDQLGKVLLALGLDVRLIESSNG